MISSLDWRRQLCVEAKSEERRLAILRKHQQLRTPPSKNKLPPSFKLPITSRPIVGNQRPTTGNQPTPPRNSSQFLGCYNCGQEGHRIKDCRAKKTDSRGYKQSKKFTTAQVKTTSKTEVVSHLRYWQSVGEGQSGRSGCADRRYH